MLIGKLAAVQVLHPKLCSNDRRQPAKPIEPAKPTVAESAKLAVETTEPAITAAKPTVEAQKPAKIPRKAPAKPKPTAQPAKPKKPSLIETDI